MITMYTRFTTYVLTSYNAKVIIPTKRSYQDIDSTKQILNYFHNDIFTSGFTSELRIYNSHMLFKFHCRVFMTHTESEIIDWILGSPIFSNAKYLEIPN